jgi:hypothetical protein
VRPAPRDPARHAAVPDRAEHRSAPLRQLAVFYGSVFAVTWGLAALLFLAPDLLVGPEGVEGGRGRLFWYLAVFAPTGVGVVLTLRELGVRAGLAHIARGAVAPGRWRRTALWLLVGAYAIPLSWAVVAGLGRIGAGAAAEARFDAFGVFVLAPVALLTTTYLLTDPGPLGEEYGWRGYALPRLMQLVSPTAAGVVVGALMALWHLPSFFAAQLVQSELNLLLMTTNWIGWGVVSAWIHVRSGGNWVAAGLVPHAVLNAAFTLGHIDVDVISGTGALLAAVVLVALGLTDPARRRPATSEVIEPHRARR